MTAVNRFCPVCASSDAAELRVQRFELPAGHPLSDGYRVVQCRRCDFAFADTTASQADYDRFYASFSKYEDGKTGTGAGETPFDRARLEATARQIAEELADPAARILDVGCANGGLLRALKDLGYRNQCGLDPSPTCVANTKSLGLEAHQGSLFKPFPHGLFDCVVLSHTLEHIQDVRGALEWIGERLDPNGRRLVYIETPDATRYVDFLYAPFQEFNTEHINHFSRTSLINALEMAGYETLHTGQKVVEVNANMGHPAVFGFWRKSAVKAEVPRRDPLMVERMAEYVARSKADLEAMDARLRAVIGKHPRVVVWGTGQLAIKLLIETCLGQADIAAFVDSNPINHGKVLRGVEIIAPAALRDRPEPIVITTTLHHRAIADQIRAMGLGNELVVLAD
jgi:SAM-dependent methyltransferase